MIACQRCQATYSDDEMRYCGRCGSDMRQIASLDNLARDDSAPRPNPLIGRVVDGRYRLLEIIGAGGMGTVFKVEHVAMGKLAALKMLHPTLSSDREIVKRFRREAEAVSLLTHPSTVQVFDFGEAEGCLYMVMELVRGEDLAAVLRRDGPMPWARAAPLLEQICEALAEAHEKGVIHRDLKPENVLVSRAPQPGGGRDVAKVLDFGLAKLREREELGSVTARGSLIGTPFYMSPEQIRSEEPDPRSDIYSFGAMTYRMLTGQHPFAGPTPVAVLTQHLTDELIAPSKRRPDLVWDERVEALVIRCMAKRREDRYPNIDAVREAVIDAMPSAGSQPKPLPAGLATPPARKPLTGAEGAATAPQKVIERRNEASTSHGKKLSREDVGRFERSLKLRRWFALASLPLLLCGAAAAGWFLYHRGAGVRAVEAEIEPNDGAETANLIASGQTVRGFIGKRITVEESDRDFYRFHADGPAVLRLQLQGIPNMDLRLALFDGTGGKLAENNEGGPGDTEVIPNQRLDGGDYYVEVREVWVSGRQATENVTDQYALTATWHPPQPDEEAEPDDAPEQAIALPLGRPVHGYLHKSGDTDWYYPSGAPVAALEGDVSGIDGVDLRLIALPAGVAASEDAAKTPGAKVIDAGGPGKPEHLADLAWPAGGAPPRIAVQRKDPGRSQAPEHRVALPGGDSPYSFVLRAAAPH
jgi:serine/threonine-protein kinase